MLVPIVELAITRKTITHMWEVLEPMAASTLAINKQVVASKH
jgi:hypothetical protein